MTEATSSVAAMASPSAAVRTIDSTFVATYQIFEEFRTVILVVAGSRTSDCRGVALLRVRAFSYGRLDLQ